MSASVLPHLLEHAAAATPEALAIVDSDESYTWAELNQQANRIANTLSSQGVVPGDRVILRLTKSVHAVAAAYGIMKCGAAYVPLDIGEPAERSQDAIRDATATVAIAEPSRKGGWKAVEGTGLRCVINLGKAAKSAPSDAALLTPDDVVAASSEQPAIQLSPDMLAYMLYTSGSTGKRKGVMLTHANSMAFVTWAAAATELTASDRLSSHAPMHFDLSVFDLYAAASVGATTYIVPGSASMFPTTLASFIQDNKISVWYSVPTVLRLLAERGGLSPGDLPDLRMVVFAGEVYPPARLRELIELVPDARFWNWFGPTETNVCTAYRVSAMPDPDSSVPIGRPASGAEAFVVDEDGNEVEPGTQGELLISGPTVHAGYWQNPERTASTLVPHPHDPARTAYRTGDLVALDDNGDFVFAGRNDHQIKTRGYRVELGDIESFLTKLDGVNEAVVVPVPNEQFTHVLHAYVVADDELRSSIVKASRAGLPSYMVPSTISCVDSLPRTLNHKVDRQNLTAQAIAAAADGDG